MKKALKICLYLIVCVFAVLIVLAGWPSNQEGVKMSFEIFPILCTLGILSPFIFIEFLSIPATIIGHLKAKHQWKKEQKEYKKFLKAHKPNFIKKIVNKILS